MAQNRQALLIIGCGYLGQAVARLSRSRYHEIHAFVASSRARPALREMEVSIHIGDVFDKHGLNESLSRVSDGLTKHAIVMLPPSAIPQNPTVVSVLSEQLQAAGCVRALLISSTGVYGSAKNELVTAESTEYADTKRALRLRQIEIKWQAAASQNMILRLAGIYGPNRLVGLKSLGEEQTVGGSPNAWLNLIHVNDAAALCLRCLGSVAARVELGADGHPVKRGEYYRYLATSHKLPAPVFAGETERNTNSKRCNPLSTFQRLNFRPKFPDYRLGIQDALKINQE